MWRACESAVIPLGFLTLTYMALQYFCCKVALLLALCVYAYLCFLPASFAAVARQKDEVFNEQTHQSFQNAVAVMPLFARSVAAELREASDQVGRH